MPVLKKECSPATDAARVCAAFSLDNGGQARVDITAVTNTGDETGVDMGAYEYQGDRSPVSLPVATCCKAGAGSTPAHGYWLCSDTKPWAEAKAFCQASDIHLVSIDFREFPIVIRCGAATIAIHDYTA